MTACRKRLRFNRVAQRAAAVGQSEEFLAEEAPPLSLAYDLATATLTLESETLQLVEQEVGIT